MLVSSNGALEPDSLFPFCETDRGGRPAIPSLLLVWFHWGRYLSAEQSGGDGDAGGVAVERSSSGGWLEPAQPLLAEEHSASPV